MPVPGAIGTFGGSPSELGGDSSHVAPILNGNPVPTGPLRPASLPHFKGAQATDPLVFPANSPALLTDAGVDAELHVWDGMWHSFFSDPELPESREAYAVMIDFFKRKLGRQTGATAAAAFAPQRSDRYSLDYLSPAAKP